MNVEALENRLRKRARHLRRWAERWPTDSYRVYDRDIPEWAFAIDRYGDSVHLQQYLRQQESAELAEARLQAVSDVVVEALGVDASAVHWKQRQRQKESSQYERLDAAAWTVAEEDGLKFRVDLAGHLDTGLFLDHREMRRLVAADVAARKAPRVANLFCYTGAFSVWAARAGGVVTSVDLSNTYLDWAKENFGLNGLELSDHRFERSDVLRWLPQELQRVGRYDVLVLDPPTFSRSKKMLRDLDTQRDHLELVKGSRALLAPGGTLYFSTNFRNFVLDPELASDPQVEELTRRTVPEDFKAGIHRAWCIRNERRA